MAKNYRSQKEGLRVRTEACRLAATVLAGHPERLLSPTCWSLAVFFEKYMLEGADRTMKEFGPKKPAKLRVVNKGQD